MNVSQGKELFQNIINQHAHVYVALKILKMEYLAEQVANSLVDSPEFANHLLGSLSNITSQTLLALRANVNIGLTKMKMHGLDAFPSYQHLSKSQISPDKPKFPYPIEIGRFLLKKITLNPPSYEACVSVMDHYEQNDLYKVMRSLEKGIHDHSTDKIADNVEQLNTVMDNIWLDANKLKDQKTKVATGIDVCIGVVGEFASHALGSFGGLLAGLGFAVADRKFGFTDSLNEKILRVINKDYLVEVYNFRRQYPKTS